MISVRLRLRPNATAPETSLTQAWLVQGGDAATWIAGLRRLGVALDGARGAILPRSAADPTPSALLVLPAACPGSRVAGAWTVRADRIAYPSEAMPWPPLDADELAGLLVNDFTVLHPGIGRIGFATDDLLDLTRLVAPPPRAGRRWQAHATPAPARLIAVEAVLELDLAALLESARGDIGSRPVTELDAEQPKPGPLANLGAHTQAALARAFLRLYAALPGGAKAPTWIDGLAQWAQNRLAASTSVIDAARHRELSRLLRLLDEDPDQALRFALPIGGVANHRGIAPPGMVLGSRATDFDLAGLRRGGRGDFWDVPPAMRVDLERKYRLAAEREIALGRHRRAAYILAQLLGDHAGAARALELGKHWRDAAVLWREHLKQPREAAQCLERGGLWSEAAILWRELGDREREAICLEHAGDPAAAEVWRMAIAACLQNGDVVHAAQLAEQRLHDTGWALELLAATWPVDSRAAAHAQASACLDARLALLGRLGRHGDSTRLTDHVVATMPDVLLPPVARLFATVATTYPDVPVRRRAADALRRLVGARLAAGEDVPAAVLAALPLAQPADRLLGRDAARWPRLARAASRRPAATRTRHFQLEAGKHWCAAGSAGATLVAMEVTTAPHGIGITRLDLITGATQSVAWEQFAPGGHLAFLVIACSDRLMAKAHFDGEGHAKSFAMQRMPACDAFPQPLTAEVHHGVLSGVLGVGGWQTLHQMREGHVLGRALVRGRNPEPLPIPHDLHPGFLRVGPQRWLAEIGDEPCLVAGELLVKLGRPDDVLVLPAEARGVVAHPKEACVVVSLVAGIAACWWHGDGWKSVEVAESWSAPALTFTRDGLLVASDGATYRSYTVAGGKVVLVREWPRTSDARIIALCPGPAPDEFVEVARDGAVQVVQTC